MPEYLHPGVYIEETSYRGKPIEGVGTSTAGFVGRARSGPEGVPTLVTSFNQFRRTFGESISEPSGLGDHLGHAVRAFFENGGRRCYVVRVLAADALVSSRAVVQGTVLRLPPTVTVRGPTANIPLDSLRNVDAGSVLRVWTRPSASAPFAELGTMTVDSYDATRGVVTVIPADALAPGTALEPTNTLFLVTGVSPHGAATPGPTFTARHRGAGGDAISVEIRPRDLPPVVLPVASALRAQPVIASLSGTGPGGGANTVTLPASALARLRVGDWISFSGTTPEEVQVQNIDAATVAATLDSGGANQPASAAISLVQRGGAPAPAPIPLGELPALQDVSTGTVTLPHDAAAYLRVDVVIRIGTAELTVVAPGVTFAAAPVQFMPSLMHDHATSDVSLVRAADTGPNLLRVIVGSTGAFEAPYGAGSFEPGAVVRGTERESADILLVDPTQGIIVLDWTAITDPVATAAGWSRVESLRIAPAGNALRVASTGSFYTGAVVELDPGPDAGFGKEYLVVAGVDPGARTVTFASAPSFGGAGFVDVPADPSARRAYVRTLEIDVLVAQDGRVVESFSGLSWNPAPSAQSFGRYYLARINDPDSGSRLVTVAPPPAPAPLTASGQPITETGFAQHLTGGDDGSALAPIDLVGVDNGPGKRTGIEALREREDIAICAVPGVVEEIVQGALITHCELMRYRFAVLDGRVGRSDVSEIQAHRNNYDSKYAAYYAPWLRTLDSVTGRSMLAPPSGYAAGIYARSDNQRGVHKAPANEVVRNVLDVELPFGDGEQDVLNPAGVNLIREFVGRGIRVWGARTISSDPEWKYVNVRRLFIYLEHSIDRGTQWVVFEPNNESLWARVVETITSFLIGVWKTGALMGTKPEEAFFVRCDRSTMTQDDIDNGRLVCEIGVAPTMPAEFVIFRIGQFTASSPGA